jgi:hypothetical protein
MNFAKPVPDPTPAPVPTPKKNVETKSKSQQLLDMKGKTVPTWESVLQTIEALVAAFEEIIGGGVEDNSATVAPVSKKKIAIKG